MLNRIDAGAQRVADAVRAVGVGRHPAAELVGFVGDRLHFLQ